MVSGVRHHMSEEINGAVQKRLAQPGSSFKQYQQSTVGDFGILHLILYECVNLACVSLPGRIGGRIRRWGLSLVTAHIGKMVKIGINIFILQPKKLRIEDKVEIGNAVTLGIKNTGDGIILKEHVKIGDRTNFNCLGGTITVGKGTSIDNDCRLGSLKGLTLGEFCTVGRYTCISGAGHAISDLARPIIEQPIISKGQTIIGDHVVIGERATILDGVIIGNNVTIAADSLVNRDIPAYSHVKGIPARICRQSGE